MSGPAEVPLIDQAKLKVPDGFNHCKCGWSGLPHVSDMKLQRCISAEQVLINEGLSKSEAKRALQEFANLENFYKHH